MSDLMIELFALVHDPAFESILENIFLHLDGSSLLHCRLVCSQWRSFIINRIFHNKKSRLIVEERLHKQWIYAEPSETRIEFQGYDENITLFDEEHPAHIMECDDDIIVCANERFLEIRKMPFGEVDVRFKDFKVHSNKAAEIQQVLLSDTIIATITYFVNEDSDLCIKTYQNKVIVKMFSRDDYSMEAEIVTKRFDFQDETAPQHRIFLIKNTLWIVRQKERRIYSEDSDEYEVEADGPVCLRQFDYDPETELVTQSTVNLEHDYVLHEHIETASVDASGEHFLFLGGHKCLVYLLKSGVKVLDIRFDNRIDKDSKAQLFDTTANKTYAIIRNNVPFFNSNRYADCDFLVIDLDSKSIVYDIVWDISDDLKIHKRLVIQDHDSGKSDGEGEYTLEFYPTRDFCGVFLDPTEKQNVVRDGECEDIGYLFYKDPEEYLPRTFKLVDNEWVDDDCVEDFNLLRTFVVDSPGFDMQVRKNKTSLVCLLNRWSHEYQTFHGELRIYNFFRNLDRKK